jgi:dihydrolipoamide dehydrogenase
MSKKIAVIGSGPAGYPAAFRLAGLGADVTVIEKEEIGGVCLNWGCIPSKSYLDSAHRLEILKSLENLTADGSETELEKISKNISWEKIQSRRTQTVSMLKKGLEHAFKLKKINLIKGMASFVSNKEISIKTQGKTIKETFDYFIIACGSESFFPPPFGKYKEKLLDNKSVFSLEKQPHSIIIIGGGVIGVEFACFFSALGVKVDIVEIMPNILPGEDENIVRVIKSSLEKRGISIHLGLKAKDLKISGDRKELVLENGAILKAEHILVAAGRTFGGGGLGLENARVSWDSKGIKVDKDFKAAGNIYAVGDANGQMMLAHAASAQGVYVANHVMGGETFYDNSLVPKCIYTFPESASVGLDKNRAEKEGRRVKAGRAFFLSNAKAQSTGETEGFVQIISDAENGQILGAQIAGGSATEMIHIFSVAILSEMTAEDFKKVIFAHPTMSETIAQALER